MRQRKRSADELRSGSGGRNGGFKNPRVFAAVGWSRYKDEPAKESEKSFRHIEG
jgi:hypothetical protein